MLVRVLEIPPPSRRFHFADGEAQHRHRVGERFVEVDWFLAWDDQTFASLEGQQQITEFIQAKNYYRTDQAYLVLHPLHSFTINYAAP